MTEARQLEPQHAPQAAEQVLTRPNAKTDDPKYQELSPEAARNLILRQFLWEPARSSLLEGMEPINQEYKIENIVCIGEQQQRFGATPAGGRVTLERTELTFQEVDPNGDRNVTRYENGISVRVEHGTPGVDARALTYFMPLDDSDVKGNPFDSTVKGKPEQVEIIEAGNQAELVLKPTDEGFGAAMQEMAAYLKEPVSWYDQLPGAREQVVDGLGRTLLEITDLPERD